MTRSQQPTAHLKAPSNPPPARPPDGALHHSYGAQRARRGKEAAKGGLAVHGHALPEGVGVGAGVQGAHLQQTRRG